MGGGRKSNTTEKSTKTVRCNLLHTHTTLHTLHSMPYLEMELAVDCFILLVHQLECMGTVPIHVTEPIRYPTISEQK